MKTIMLQGTASDVGKSVLSTAFCRYFLEEGFRIAPFKSQNMALNSYVTRDGGEIGRSQGVQAEAAGVEATVDMNPVLLKPKGEMVSEVIVHGRHFADVDARSYRGPVLDQIMAPIRESLERLSREYEILVIEGAGSPAEINLKNRDVVNMRIAHLADAPVLLVADIERGGVFASIVGTLELLEPQDRARVKGFVINKFRGSKDVLDPGIEWLEKRTGIPVLGVLPHVEIGIDPEDSMSLASLQLKGNRKSMADLDVAVIRFPRISNFTDFLPLMNLADTAVRYVKSIHELGQPDVIILPGTKNTMDDLDWLKATGLAKEIFRLKDQGSSVLVFAEAIRCWGKSWQIPTGWNQAKKNKMVWDCSRLRPDLSPAKRPYASRENHWPPGAVRNRLTDMRFIWAEPVYLPALPRYSSCRIIAWTVPFLKTERCGEPICTVCLTIFPSPIIGLTGSAEKKACHSRRKNLPNRQESREEVYAFLSEWIREYVDMEKVKEIMGLRS